MGLNEVKPYLLGVDIGGTKILVAVTDRKGHLVYSEKLPTTSDVNELGNRITLCLERANINPNNILSMGVGVPGVVHVDTGWIDECAALDWGVFNLKEALEPQFPFPVFINNDVNCAGLGEKWLGACKNTKHLFFIALGTGVGSAVISNGEMVYGHHYQAGEIGYTISVQEYLEGKRNSITEFGWFERKVSGPGLTSEKWSALELFQACCQGDEEAQAIIEQFMINLAVFIANSINLLNPEFVIIGGGVSESMAPLIPKIQAMVDEITPIRTTIQITSLGEKAGALGAAAFGQDQLSKQTTN